MKHPSLISVAPSSAASEVYQAYPRKVGRPSALRAIQRAISLHGYEHVLKRTQEFTTAWQRSGKSLEYIPYPTTFFNQERYNDDFAAMFPATSSAPSAAAQFVSSQQELNRVLERMKGIKNSYHDHQNWTQGDIDNWNKLKARRDVLRKQLGITA